MRRLLVNDCLSALPDHRTFWNDLQDWFGMEFVGGEYPTLLDKVQTRVAEAGDYLVVRNGSYFPARLLYATKQICLLQDIFADGPSRKMQEEVLLSCDVTVFNSEFTQSKYPGDRSPRVIPLPVDFFLFEPGNAMGLQQALSLPDGCVCWVGACQAAAGHVKGWDIFLQVVRLNPDIPFVGVFKDALPDSVPPNLRCYVRLAQEELAKVMGACRVGLCTSRMESQHLAGIEMGACGLPMVTRNVGTYWNRTDIPGILVGDDRPAEFTAALRGLLSRSLVPFGEYRGSPCREYWRKEFDREVIRKQWEKLIEQVECSGA